MARDLTAEYQRVTAVEDEQRQMRAIAEHRDREHEQRLRAVEVGVTTLAAKVDHVNGQIEKLVDRIDRMLVGMMQGTAIANATAAAAARASNPSSTDLDRVIVTTKDDVTEDQTTANTKDNRRRKTLREGSAAVAIGSVLAVVLERLFTRWLP